MDAKTTSQKVNPSPHMIVDFPCRPRSTRRQVRFSQFSQLVTIPYDDAKSKWYTQEEERRFKQAMFSDARMLRYVLQNASSSLIKEGIIYECVGMEKFISGVSTELHENKRKHSEIVLAAQMICQGNNRIEKISEISKKFSLGARERAAKVAACWRVYDDDEDVTSQILSSCLVVHQ